MRRVTSAPLCVLDIALHDIGAPRQGLIYKESDAAELAGPGDDEKGMRTLLVRQGLAQGYISMFEKPAFFAPFVALTSLYVRARYRPQDRRSVLVMRDGFLGRFADTAQGRAFFLGLHEATLPPWPWELRFLVWEKTYLSHRELAAHQAVVYMPGMPWGKMTYKDLIAMEIPMFFPARRMLLSVIGPRGPNCEDAGAFAGCLPYECLEDSLAEAPAWSLALCDWPFQAWQLELSEFYRYPPLQYFGGLADLVAQLASVDADQLTSINHQMQAFNQLQLEDDDVFWASSVRALACSSSGKLGSQTQSLRFRGISEDPKCMFGRRGGGLGISLGSSREVCCAAWCNSCAEASCEASKVVRQNCCPSAIVEDGVPCSTSAAPCLSPEEPLPAPTCEQGPEGCQPEVLRFAMHIQQKLPRSLAYSPLPD